jgi:predicted DNA-binding protein with PD1-like motif
VESIKCTLTSEMILARFDPGERLLEGLRELIRAEGIRTGLVVSGIGTLSDCRLHQSVAGYPPNLLTRHQEYLEFKGSYEIASIQGIIADGEPHLHLTISEGDHTVAGHLEDGCVVLTLAEVAILRAGAAPVRRVVRGPEKIKRLTAAE